jgi:hypothetical protein
MQHAPRSPRSHRSLVPVLVAAVAIPLATAPALAGSKPTTAEAQATVTAWIDAMELSQVPDPEPPSAAAMALSAWPFHAAYYSDGETGCPATVTTDEASTSTALQCLGGNLIADGKMKPWSKKIAKQIGIPYIHKKDLRALAKSATLVMVETECAGVGNQVVFAVVKDKAGALKVSAALGLQTFCGE